MLNCLLLLIMASLCPNDILLSLEADTTWLTVREAEQMLEERNPQLQMSTLDVEMAASTLRQERLWENPEADLLYNVNNPVTGHYFEAGPEGEIDIAVEQPIPIGGQRRQRINRQKAMVSVAENERDWNTYRLKMELHRTIADICFLREKVETFDSEIHSVDRILTAYRKQEKEGNLSKIEIVRMEAFKLQLVSGQNEWRTLLERRENDLRLLLGTSGNWAIRMDETAIFNDMNSLQWSTADLTAKTETRPDLVAIGFEAQSAERDLKLQRANRLPRVSVKAEYDKNGNIGHNFWGVGLKTTIPVFDRNQGNIRSASLMMTQKHIEEQALKHEIVSEVALCRNRLQRQWMLLNDARQTTAADFSPEAIERRMLDHDLSMLDFISIYDAYRETRLILIDERNSLIQTIIDLNEAVGEEIIKIR